MINLDNINKVLMCDECNSEFEIKYSEDNSKQNFLKCTSCDIQYKIVIVYFCIWIAHKYVKIQQMSFSKFLGGLF